MPPSFDEQLALWAAGTSVHAEQCVPDFSCCQPELLQPEDVRRAFVAASPEQRDQHLSAFLSAGLAFLAQQKTEGGQKKVYLAGQREST